MSAQPLSGAGTRRYLLVRTLLVFTRSIKPDKYAEAVESDGNSPSEGTLPLEPQCSHFALYSNTARGS